MAQKLAKKLAEEDTAEERRNPGSRARRGKARPPESPAQRRRRIWLERLDALFPWIARIGLGLLVPQPILSLLGVAYLATHTGSILGDPVVNAIDVLKLALYASTFAFGLAVIFPVLIAMWWLSTEPERRRSEARAWGIVHAPIFLLIAGMCLSPWLELALTGGLNNLVFAAVCAAMLAASVAYWALHRAVGWREA
jgi:hypothetical protein